MERARPALEILETAIRENPKSTDRARDPPVLTFRSRASDTNPSRAPPARHREGSRSA
jgi:hypothetical protein